MYICRSQWPRGLRRRSTAARLQKSWVRIPQGAWMFVCCECCVLSGRGLCDALITRPEESYRFWCVVVCDLETSRMRRPWPTLGRNATRKNKPTFTTEHETVKTKLKSPFISGSLREEYLWECGKRICLFDREDRGKYLDVWNTRTKLIRPR